MGSGKAERSWRRDDRGPEDVPRRCYCRGECWSKQKPQQSLIEQIQDISVRMVKYIGSSIHTGVLQTIATIKSWYPQQDMQCLLERANPDATDEQLAEYQVAAQLIADHICQDLCWGKE